MNSKRPVNKNRTEKLYPSQVDILYPTMEGGISKEGVGQQTGSVPLIRS